jgi:hypothetical protein
MQKTNEGFWAGLIERAGLIDGTRQVARQSGVTGLGLCRVSAVAVGALLAFGVSAWAQDRIGPPAPVTYDNKLEFYGGLNFMNFQAGQNLPKRMNLGGTEISATYWFTKNWGAVADYRGDAGTTPVFADIININRPLVLLNTAMFGAQYRGPKNQFAALNFHGYGGVSNGIFDLGTGGSGPENGTAASNATTVGLYSNRTRPMFAVGGSIDINRSQNWAVRLSPDMIFEHFGTETREFFAISGGIVYRVPVKKAKKK